MNPYNQLRNKDGRFIKGIRYRPIKMCLYCGINEIRTGRKWCSMKCFGLAKRGTKSHRKGKTLEREYGKDRANEIRNDMSNSHIGQRPNNYGNKMPKYSGDKHWNWQNGKTKLNWQIRESLEYKIWRRTIWERDNYTCQRCKKETSGRLRAHHIKPFVKILEEYHITTLNQAIKCEELWDIKNGITLCLDCHEDTDSYPINLRKR